MADYNANTNWDNERAYLNNMINGLKSDGSPASSGEQAWAKGQLNVLENEYAKYNQGTSQVVSSIADDASQYLSELYGLINSSNAQAIEQATLQNEWQVEQNAKAMEFNSLEAQKNRDWQEYMSNTAHQREVEDLKAAGLNPVLSATGGNGAAVTSGATASGVTSAGTKADLVNNSIINLIGTMYQARLNQENAQLTAKTALETAKINADASRYASGINFAIQESRNSHDIEMAQNYPDNPYNLIEALLYEWFGDKDKKVNTGTQQIPDAKSRSKIIENSIYNKDRLNSKELNEMINAYK